MTQLPRRRGGPTLTVIVDLFRDAAWTRNWLILVAVIISVLAALAALVGQTVLPWTIYPAL